LHGSIEVGLKILVWADTANVKGIGNVGGGHFLQCLKGGVYPASVQETLTFSSAVGQ
jgi:hypothetical protein